MPHIPYQPFYPFVPETMWLWTVFVFITGACMGSFLNVCIWRIPNDESVIFTPSHCPKCNHQLRWYENIPFLSWICLHGRCSSCKNPISPRYILVELLTACLFLAAWLQMLERKEPVYFFLPYMVMIMLIVATAFIDCEHFIIPNEITYPAMGFGLVYAFLFPKYWWTTSSFIALSRSCGALLTGLVSFAVFAVLGKFIFRKEALGWGDVKYLGAVGACLGFLGCFYTVFFGAALGSIIGISMLFFSKNKKNIIPFGPYLAAGSLIWILFGPQIFDWFLNFSEMMRH